MAVVHRRRRAAPGQEQEQDGVLAGSRSVCLSVCLSAQSMAGAQRGSQEKGGIRSETLRLSECLYSFQSLSGAPFEGRWLFSNQKCCHVFLCRPQNEMVFVFCRIAEECRWEGTAGGHLGETPAPCGAALKSGPPPWVDLVAPGPARQSMARWGRGSTALSLVRVCHSGWEKHFSSSKGCHSDCTVFNHLRFKEGEVQTSEHSLSQVFLP